MGVYGGSSSARGLVACGRVRYLFSSFDPAASAPARYVDCDVVVAEVRETSRKPDEMYSLLERLSPGTRKLEIFARKHNLKPGWVGLGNQLESVNIIDPELRERFRARYGFDPNANENCQVK